MASIIGRSLDCIHNGRFGRKRKPARRRRHAPSLTVVKAIAPRMAAPDEFVGLATAAYNVGPVDFLPSAEYCNACS